MGTELVICLSQELWLKNGSITLYIFFIPVKLKREWGGAKVFIFLKGTVNHAINFIIQICFCPPVFDMKLHILSLFLRLPP